MDAKNSCYTYFRIVGNFNPDSISELLNLTADKSWKIADLQHHGTMFDFANWEIGHCCDYDIEVANQMRKTISILIDKIDLLNKIRKDSDVCFYLEIVPTIYAEDTASCLSPPLDVIDFCHTTRTKIDIDMYVCDSKDE